MIKFFTLITAGALLSAGAFGQAPNRVTQGLEWTSLNLTVGLTKKIGIVNDGNFRFIENFQSQQNQLRSGLEYTVSKKLSVVPIGYSYIWNYIYGKQPAAFAYNEFRFWQQVQYKHTIGKFAIGHRLRIEERDIERYHASETGTKVYDGYVNDQIRLRYRLNTTLPLMKTPGASHYYYLNVWDELHYSWGKYVKYSTPSQNRIFAGIGYQFSRSTSFQTGFLYQWMKKDNGVQAENNIGVLLQFNYAFALFKKAK